MITTFTLRLLVENSIIFQDFSGFASCGIFYNLIKSINNSLAEELHSSKRLAPWSATPIFIESPLPSRIVYKTLPAPSIVNVVFTVMDQKISEIFRDAILKSLSEGGMVDLVRAKAKIINVAVNMKKFSEIADSEPLFEKFAIKFLTPTAFRRSVFDCCPLCPEYVKYTLSAKNGQKLKKPCEYAISCRGLNIPLPLPSLLFKNLARIWSTFSDKHLNVWEAARWAENAMLIAGFPKPGIRTVRVYEHPMTNRWITGFIGTVRFAVRRNMYRKDYAKTAAALLKMAEMTNVGVRRTAGLGMIKYVIPTKG